MILSPCLKPRSRWTPCPGPSARQSANPGDNRRATGGMDDGTPHVADTVTGKLVWEVFLLQVAAVLAHLRHRPLGLVVDPRQLAHYVLHLPSALSAAHRTPNLCTPNGRPAPEPSQAVGHADRGPALCRDTDAVLPVGAGSPPSTCSLAQAQWHADPCGEKTRVSHLLRRHALCPMLPAHSAHLLSTSQGPGKA